ncbi:MAG TPA: hypothetical protein VFW65_18270 [Pseudonocardiaceae bacterium]|nr:hypothetical protein [Pseudonocardiaceae bacterium]
MLARLSLRQWLAVQFLRTKNARHLTQARRLLGATKRSLLLKIIAALCVVAQRTGRRRYLAVLLDRIVGAADVFLNAEASDLRGIGEEMRDHTTLRAIALDASAIPGSYENAIDQVTSSPHHEIWIPAFTGWLAKRDYRDQGIPEQVYNGIVMDGLAVTGRTKLTLLLRTVRFAASTLSNSEAKEVLHQLLILARQSIDPYADPSLILLARRAAVDLLALRPDLDEKLHSILDEERRTPLSAKELDTRKNIYISLHAMGLRSRTPDGGQSLIATINAAKISGDGVASYARLANSAINRQSRPVTFATRGALLVAVLAIASALLPFVIAPSAAFLIGLYAYGARWRIPPVVPGLGDGIAALAALVTVNVFTVQLASARLPGIIARGAAQLWYLTVSYAASLWLLAVTLIPIRPGRLVSAVSWSSIASLVIFAISLLLAVVRIVNRTDAAKAVDAFLASKIRDYRSSGRKHRRIQARALSLREALGSIATVVVSVESMVGEYSTTIRSEMRGFLNPDVHHLRRLLRDPTFSRGTILRIVHPIGVIASAHDKLASVVPGQSETVSKATTRRASNALSITTSADVEEVSVAAVAIVALAIELAAKGEAATADSLGRSLVTLLADHMREARSSRFEVAKMGRMRVTVLESGYRMRRQAPSATIPAYTNDAQIAPVVPAVRDTITALIRHLRTGAEASTHVINAILKELLDASGQADAVIEMVATAAHVNQQANEDTDRRLLEILRLAGLRALELDATSAWDLVIRQIEAFTRKELAFSEAMSSSYSAGASADGSHAPVVNNSRRTSSLSRPHLVAVSR